MLASLVVLASLVYVVVTRWLPMLRRVITPVASGTALMLIAVMILPFAIALMRNAPENAGARADPAVVAVMLIAIVLFVVCTPRAWQMCSLLIGILAGCVTAAFFNLYDFRLVSEAHWIGLPDNGLPGLKLTPTIGFWALLPMFLIIALVQAIKGIGDASVVQRASQDGQRAIDFRLIQG